MIIDMQRLEYLFRRYIEPKNHNLSLGRPENIIVIRSALSKGAASRILVSNNPNVIDDACKYMIQNMIISIREKGCHNFTFKRADGTYLREFKTGIEVRLMGYRR